MREPLHARLAIGFDGPEPPSEIMFMPGGEHELTASRAGRPVAVRLLVDRSAAAAMQQSLQEHLSASAQRPYFDFDHKDEGASAWPLEFLWKQTPAPGVYARVEWSKAGAEAIRGKSYRAFSPTFFDEPGRNPARVTGAPLNMGGLVNNPAFKRILPLWAKQAPTSNSKRYTMNDDPQVIDKDAEISALRAKNESLESDRRKQLADAALNAAIKRGALPPQAMAAHAKWRAEIEARPEVADLLSDLPGSPLLSSTFQKGQSTVQITREDLTHVGQGYLQAKQRSPYEAGLIYAKEFSPLLAKGERVPFERMQPIMAANSLGTLAGNLVSQRTLELVVSRRPLLRNCVTDFTNELVKFNQTVYTRVVGLAAVQNFGTAPTDSSTTDYPVQMNQHKETRFKFLPSEYLATGRNLVNEHAESLATPIGNYMVDQVATLITAAFTLANQTEAANLKDYADIVAATKLLNTTGLGDDRCAWVNADVAEALRNDELIMAHFNRDGSAYAQWKNLEGFKEVNEYPALPGNSINLIAFWFHRNALLIASRLAVDTEAFAGVNYPGRLEPVQDPISGLTITANQFVLQESLEIHTRLIILFGCARGIVTAGQKWVSA